MATGVLVHRLEDAPVDKTCLHAGDALAIGFESDDAERRDQRSDSAAKVVP
jgi:hypothetical protein